MTQARTLTRRTRRPKRISLMIHKLYPLLICLLFACTHTAQESYRISNWGYRAAVGNVSPKAKIFLVAGSNDLVNFAKEVIDQKKFWLKQGYTEEEIACYYIPPSSEEDNKQYGELFQDLRNCYFADPKILFSHLKTVSQSNPPYIYLYITSRGSIPLADQLRSGLSLKLAKEQKIIEEVAKYPAWGNPYTLQMMGKYNNKFFGVYDDYYKFIEFGPKSPQSSEDYLLTPTSLKKHLALLPPSTKKTVVLQGCYTGGFILPAKVSGEEHTLQGLKNINVYTTASAAKTDSGCNSSAYVSIFGESYYTALLKYAEGKKLPQVNWKDVFSSSRDRIKESEEIYSLEEGYRSDPQAYAN
jgi:hypothetical protein